MFMYIQTACIYVYIRMRIDPKYGTCTINVIGIYMYVYVYAYVYRS